MPITILIIEDDMDLAAVLQLFLRDRGYQVILADRGEAGLEILRNCQVDLVIMDLMLPGMDGFTVLGKMRCFLHIPVIILSALSQEADMVRGLSEGGDIYLTKPVRLTVLLANVKAALRRSSYPTLEIPGNCLKIRGLALNIKTMCLKKDGDEIPLTAAEFRLLEMLMSDPGRVYTRRQLIGGLGTGYEEADAVSAHICNLRKKLGTDPEGRAYIITVRGLGYKLEK